MQVALKAQLFAIGVLLFVAGCGGNGQGPATYSVSGKVMLAGKPVEKGQIRFLDTSGKALDPAVAPIVNGDYSASVSAGTKRVEIEVYAATGIVFDGVPSTQQVAPEKYNSKSTLTAEVKSTGKNEISFPLE